ncbi:MAG TPA: HD domain-containing protein [Chitinophagaceae bacterium]|nr:HD domain-containing protein [Chitinophagaceae bacterium]
MARYTDFKRYITSYLKRELAPDLYYHGFHHTEQVMENVIEIARAEKLNRYELTLLKVAVWMHDAGFAKVYIGHEDASKVMTRKLLPEYGYSREEIKLICGMIEATKIPQKPTTLCEKILADADLLYLGTSAFKKIGDTLYEEMKIYAGLQDVQTWNLIQQKFLESHSFHTRYCHDKYEPAKQRNLKKVIALNEKLRSKAS